MCLFSLIRFAGRVGSRATSDFFSKQLFSEDVVVFGLHLVVDGHVVRLAVAVVVDQLRHDVGHVVAFGPLVGEPALVNTEPDPEDHGDAVAAVPLGSGGGRYPGDAPDVIQSRTPGGGRRGGRRGARRGWRRREFDAEDIDSVERVLADVGANIDGFKDYAAGPGLQANAQFQSDAFESGIYGVPTYVLANKVLPNQGLPDEVLPSEDKGVPQKFFGREHLPLIRWYLQGQVGGRPDVAYEVGDDVQILADPELPTDSILPVYIDVKAPQSYLALAGTLAMAAKENIALDWRFFHGQPLRNPGVWIEGEDRGAMHRRIRGTYVGQDIQRYAPHALADLYVTERSSAPAFGLAWVKALAAQGQDVQVGGYVEAVLLRFWQQQEDIDSLAGVESVLLHLGVTTDGFFEFVDRAGLAAVELAATQAQELGVSVSPTYFIGTEPFQGRQHLPLLAARLRP